MATALDTIKGAMRLIGAIASGESPSGAETLDALSVLNEMIASWSNENLIIFSAVREEFTLVAGTASYTIGASGTFNTTRPIGIEQAKIEDQSSTPNQEYGLQILNLDEWSSISAKDLSGYPTKIYIDPTNPLATVYLWPVPTVANKLVLYSRKPLTSIATSGTTIDLPPGYAKALRYGLALELGPEYGKPIDPIIAGQFVEAKENIKRINIRPSYLGCDIGVLDAGNSRPIGFNIYRGE